MIILDTNVISELMRPEPAQRVFDWVASRPPSSLYTTSINQAEILAGIARLPPGRRRAALAEAAALIFAEQFAGRVLPIDDRAAPHYAAIVQRRREAGAPMSAFDALIAAAAMVASATIASRDVDDFAGCGIPLINPWAAQ